MALAGGKREPVGRQIPTNAYPWIALAVGGIWLSVILGSIFAPPMVTGSQHDRIPIAALGGWLFGAIATGTVALAAMEGIRARVTAQPLWMALGIAVAAIWAAVLLVSVFTPDFVTGTDPTMLPFGEMLSPIAGLVVTGLVCSFVTSGFRPSQSPVQDVPAVGVWAQQPSPPAVPADDAAAKLRQLPQLRDSGAITEEEFEATKHKLLSRL